ncbi:MAG: hypothetical protein M1830_009265 [Pleopsidium flavum]|nr:MAG: hypothetical protein M1830_009265 [Pleopsidium flavum]
MVDEVANVGAACSALGLDDAARKEIIDFRKEYARLHRKELNTATMQDPNSDDTRDLTFAYVEHGLPQCGIPPGKDRWAADSLEARIAPDGTQLIYSEHKDRILPLLKILMACQNQNYHHYEKYGSSKGRKEYTTSSDSASPDLRRTSKAAENIVSAGDQLGSLRSGRTYEKDASPGNQRVAPTANMGYSHHPEHGWVNSYGGLPHVIDLESTGDQNTAALKYSTSSPRDEQNLKSASHDAHPNAERSLSRVERESENVLIPDQDSKSGEGLMSAEDSEYEDSPTREGSSASEHSLGNGSEGHVPVVRSDQSASKVVVLKCRQLKKRGTDKRPAQGGKRLRSPDRPLVEHEADHEQRAKRARMREPESSFEINELPNTARRNITDTEGHRERCETIIAETHNNGAPVEHAVTAPNDGEDDSGVTVNQATALREPLIDQCRDQEPGQTEEHPPDSIHSPTFPIWLLDPRTPGRSLEAWTGSSPLSQPIQYVFDKATQLLETNDFEVLRFRFQLGDEDMEWKWRVANGESDLFERMKIVSKTKMEDVLEKSVNNAKTLELTIEPMGLAGVEISRSARAENLDGKAGNRLDPWYT